MDKKQTLAQEFAVMFDWRMSFAGLLEQGADLFSIGRCITANENMSVLKREVDAETQIQTWYFQNKDGQVGLLEKCVGDVTVFIMLGINGRNVREKRDYIFKHAGIKR